jgi:hypothetical protein
MITAINVTAALALLAKTGEPRRTTRSIAAVMEARPHEIDRPMRDALRMGWMAKYGATHALTGEGRARLHRAMTSSTIRARARTMPGGYIATAPIPTNANPSEGVTELRGGADREQTALRVACLAYIVASPACTAAEVGASVRTCTTRKDDEISRPHLRILARLGLIACEPISAASIARTTKRGGRPKWEYHPTPAGIAALAPAPMMEAAE